MKDYEGHNRFDAESEQVLLLPSSPQHSKWESAGWGPPFDEPTSSTVPNSPFEVFAGTRSIPHSPSTHQTGTQPRQARCLRAAKPAKLRFPALPQQEANVAEEPPTLLHNGMGVTCRNLWKATRQ